MNDKGLADDNIKLDIINARKQLVKLRPIHRLGVLSINTPAITSETFTEPVFLCGLSTVVHRTADDNRLKIVHNAIHRMVLALYNRRQMSVLVLTEKSPSEKVPRN
ncbi:unnamed protein product [Hymenolepis diminuta]|uniref:Uncharacterized protein n=1 Tax=Hymenolepis diminuta TaxID=6216 RepID=A0A564YHQ8_HYMDI|nr:unnamed protein product [Hymenolepis diminuta]